MNVTWLWQREVITIVWGAVNMLVKDAPDAALLHTGATIWRHVNDVVAILSFDPQIRRILWITNATFTDKPTVSPVCQVWDILNIKWSFDFPSAFGQLNSGTLIWLPWNVVEQVFYNFWASYVSQYLPCISEWNAKYLSMDWYRKPLKFGVFVYCLSW